MSQTTKSWSRRNDPELGTESNWRNRAARLWLIGCLVAAVMVAVRGFLPSAPENTPATTTVADKTDVNIKNIEEIQVGERVTTDISPDLQQLAAEEIGSLPAWDSGSIIPKDWRRVELTLSRDDGSSMEIVLLRPKEWVRTNNVGPGNQIHLSFPEMRQEGSATIRRVDPCPQIEEGDGAVVTGTFASTVTEVIDVHLDNTTELIQCTPEHPFYRADDNRFVSASGLRPGNIVQHLTGTACVTRTEPRSGTFRVHNLEVQRDHVFRVTPAGVLVHNAWASGTVGVHWTTRQGARGMDIDGVIRASDDLVWVEVAQSSRQLRRILERLRHGNWCQRKSSRHNRRLKWPWCPKSCGCGGAAYRLPNACR